MRRPVLLLSWFLVVAAQSVSQTASPQSLVLPVDVYAHTLEHRVYTNPALSFTVKFPKGWEFVAWELLRRQDAEDNKRYMGAFALTARQEPGSSGAELLHSGGDGQSGICVHQFSTLFVAQRALASGHVSSQIKIKTQTAALGSGPSAYFGENEFYVGKQVKFLSKPEIITLNGNKLSQADVHIKHVFARIVVAFLKDPAGDDGRYLVFQFLSEDSIEQAQRDSAMLQTLQLSRPRAALFSDSRPVEVKGEQAVTRLH
jgi:hypothetical protein